MHFVFLGLFFNTVPEYSSSSMYAYVVVGYLRQYHEHSTAQRRHPCTNQVRADQSTYLKKHVRTCMRRPGCFSGASSPWRLQVTCLHLKCCTIYYISHSMPFFFVASVAGGTARYAKRLTYVPGCTYIPAHAAVKLLCTYAHRMIQHLYSYTTHKS